MAFHGALCKGSLPKVSEPTVLEECEDRTCVNLESAKETFADCIDKELVEFLLAGVRFHAGLEDQIVLMPNLLSLYQDGGVGAAAAQADDMVRQGFIAVFEDLPSVPYRVIPRGVVPKAGTDELRGIADQGAPRKPLPVHRARCASGPSHRKGARRVHWANQPSDPGPAGAERPLVEALNDKCRAGDWDHEDKDTLEHAGQTSFAASFGTQVFGRPLDYPRLGILRLLVRSRSPAPAGSAF